MPLLTAARLRGLLANVDDDLTIKLQGCDCDGEACGCLAADAQEGTLTLIRAENCTIFEHRNAAWGGGLLPDDELF